MLKIKQAKFLISAPDLAHCPKSIKPEFALLGRSNVGKSSFINRLTNNNKLAKTSNTPGKTRLINLFDINNNEFYIADLPGYGYAKVSKAEQNAWQKNLEEYLLKRENLKSCFLFIDARHDIQKNDLQMYEWLKIKEITFNIILTKCDYLSRNEISKKMSEFGRILCKNILPFSSKNDFYVKNVLNLIEESIK